jgi:HemY protein
VKIALIIGILAWMLSLPGTMTVGLFDYTITMETGVFLLLATIFILVLYILYRLVSAVISVPGKVVAYHEETRVNRGFSALTRGLVAVAAGDEKEATRYAGKAKNLLPGSNGLQLLLEAQAARMRGEEGLAQNRFEELLKDKDAAFLGVRGLLKTSMDHGDTRLALDYAQQAAKMHPNQKWIIETLYVLQIENKLWSDLLDTAKKAEKLDVYTSEKIKSDRVAVHLMRYDYDLEQGAKNKALYDLNKAYKIDPVFSPAATRMAMHYINEGKERKAANVIKKAWAVAPHPDLGIVWDRLAPKKGTEIKRMKWYRDLVDISPNDAESHILAARAAMDLELWGEAKSYLMRAQNLHPTARVFRLRAIVEQHLTHHDASIHELMEKAAAALPDKVWVCSLTGIIYEEWTPVAAPHGSFNTVVWNMPGVAFKGQQHYTISSNEGELLIDPAAA